MNPYYNANLSFRPSATPEGSSDIEHLSKGLHAYINAGNDPELKKQADSIFGKTVDFDGSDVQASLIGRRIASSFGYRHDPLSYIRKNKIATPPNWSGENSQLYTLIGQDFIGKSQEAYNNHKAAKAKAVADAQKDINDSLNLLPEKIVASIESGGGVKSHGSLDPELLQRLTKYNLSETALTSQKRAALAWQYMAPAFESVDALQNPNRDLLLDVAKTLSNEKGELDPYAMSAFLLMTDKKATELQSSNSQFWSNFVDALQNYSYRTIDQLQKNDILSNMSIGMTPELNPNWGEAPKERPQFSDERVEKLYAMMNQAISTAMTPSEKAEWYAKVLSEMGTLVGESAIPMAAGAAAAAATGGGSLLLSAGAGWAGGFAASAPATINQSVAQAYLEGKINPELYGTLAGIGQAAAENVGGVATSLPVAGKLASKLTNYTASRAAGSRILANAYTRTTLNYLTAGAIETATELSEEELGGMIGTSLNTLARSMGVELSEQQYTFGEALGSMKSHEVAAMFGYSYALGLFGIPANYRAARNFATNTDNLLRAGHSPAAVRDIQNKIFEVDDRAAEIQSDTSLSLVQKQEKLNTLDQELYDYQRKVAEKDIWNIDPEILRKRLEKEGHKLNDQMELALLIEQQVDEQILKEAGMIEAVIEPGQKYRVSFLEPGEKKEDGTEAPGKIVTQEWSRNQLTNFLMTSKNEMLFESMRQFQSLLMAHAYAQQANAEQTMTAFQNLGASRPLDVMGALKEKGITPDFLHKAATHAAELRQNLESGGMSAQEAAQQAHPDFEGMTIGEVQTLSSGVSERIETELATSGGKLLALTNDSAVELGAMNIVRRDGSAIFKYVAGHATINDMLEDNLEIDIKRRVLSGELSKAELESHLRNIEAKLPGNVKLLPKGKDSYSLAELVEAYSKIATGAYLYNAQYLPLNAAEHRLVQSIGRAVDTTRYYKAFGDAYLSFANSEEGKAYLESTGKTFADILTNAGFRIGEQLAKARATAQQRAEVLEARNFEPDIEQEVKALMYQVEQENKLAEINEQEAKEPTIIPAEESITGQEIVIDPVEAVIQKIQKERLQKFYKDSISNYKKYIQQDERDLKNAREAQTRIKKALEKNNFRSEEEKDFVLYTLEHKQELEAELLEDIAHYNAQIKQEEAELEKLENELASTGEEITVEPQQEETFVNSLSSIVNPLLSLIQQGKAKTQDFARFFRDNPGITDAEATEQGIRPLTQKGSPTSAYTKGRLIASRLSSSQFDDYINGKLSRKDLKLILTTPAKEPANFSVKQAQDKGLFKEGLMVADNAIITQPNFSIKAMHASPHNFRKFSTEFMGSGEGAQSYGWGLYFMTNDLVNLHYFDAFNRGHNANFAARLDEVIFKHFDSISHYDSYLYKNEEQALGELEYYKEEERKKKEILSRSNLSNSDKDFYTDLLKTIQTRINYLHDVIKEKLYLTPATNYRVELNADDTTLLMWDEPVSDAIQDEIDALQKPVDENDWQKTFAEMKALGIKGDNSKRENLSGYQVYNELQRVLGSKKAASEWLAAHGYKGIKYLDGNSRSASEGTYNYVIFDGKDVKITAVNETGKWSMNEGWEPYTDPTANFSIRAAQNPMERFAVDPLGERIVHFVRTEAKRFARVFGDDTPQEQAVNEVQSALAIIQAVDKHLHRQDKPVAQKHRNKLTKLRSIVEKYAQMIESGRTRSFKKISPAEQKELEAAIAELEQEELNSDVTDSEKLIEDDAGMTKKTRLAREREHHRAIIREAAKGRVSSSLAAMLNVAADAMDDYLKDELLKKLKRLTATVKIKRTPSKRLKGKMTAPMYRELESAIELMGYSARQREDAIESILDTRKTLATTINSGKVNLTGGNALLIELAKNMKAAGIEVNARNLSNELAAYEARVAIFADLDSKNYEQTRTIANAIYQIIRSGRSQWQAKMDEREENIQQYLRYFLARTEAKSGKSNRITQMLEKHKWLDAISLNAAMNAAQTIMALSSYEPIRPIMQTVLTNYATASVARQKHLEEMRKQELYAYGRIIGMHPATEAGYSDKQLKELSDKFDVFYMENNKTIKTDIKVEWQEHDADGVLETYSDTLTLTKWEALNYILTYRQDDYKINAVTHGYTDSVLAKLEKFIGSDVMDYGNAMQQMLINDGTIAVYEEREGIPMRNNPLYWPGSININTLSTTREEPLVNPYHPAASHDFLHTRVRNRKEIKGQNAFSIWRRAIADRANYVYADPVTSHLESLLARDQFANRLKTLVGVGLFRQLHATINEIKHAAWQETSLQDVNNTLVATAFSSKALSVLSGNPSSLLKQTSAIANAGLMPGITPEKYLAYVLKVKQGQGHIKIADVMKLDSFSTRKRDNAYVNEMLAMGNDAKFSTLMNWAKAGMSAMDKLDLLSNAVSATVVYNHKYDELKALGSMTEEQIKKKCEQQVALYTKLLAQPLSRVDKSALYWQIGNNALGRAVLFMGSEAINKVGMLRANYISARNKGDNPATALTKVLATMGVTVGLVASINEAVIAMLTGNTPDEDDSIVAWALATWLNASFGQYLGALPIVGGVTDTFFSPYGGWFSGGIDAPGKRLIENPIRLGQMLTDDKDYSGAQWQKEITRFMRDLTSITGYAGGAYAPWSIFSTFSAFCHSLTMALNAVYPIAQGASNDAFYADLLPEWYTDAEGKNTKGRRFKSKIEKWLTPDKDEE